MSDVVYKRPTETETIVTSSRCTPSFPCQGVARLSGSAPWQELDQNRTHRTLVTWSQIYLQQTSRPCWEHVQSHGQDLCHLGKLWVIWTGRRMQEGERLPHGHGQGQSCVITSSFCFPCCGNRLQLPSACTSGIRMKFSCRSSAHAPWGSFF